MEIQHKNSTNTQKRNTKQTKQKHYGRIKTIYHISWPMRCTVIFLLEILGKNNDECVLILVIYWKKTGLLHTKISNHNIIYSS